MKKNNSMTPFQNINRSSHSRCTSAAMHDIPIKYSKQNYSPIEIDTFTSDFSKIIRAYIPNFKLPNSPDSLSNLLQSLPEVLSTICNNHTKELTEQYLLKEQSYSKTSKNLVKYEELLKQRANELEEEIKFWKLSKNNEMITIENQKDELIKAKIKLEQDISEASSLLKEKENRIETQLNEIEVLRIEAHNSKIRNQQLEWKLTQTMTEVEEKEAILKMKQEMMEKDQKEILAEKSVLENEKMVNKMLNLELIRETNESRLQNRCGSVNHIIDTNRSFYSEIPSKPLSSSRSDTKQDETSFVVTKQSFFDIVNTKRSLENSANELEDLQNNVIPEFHEKAEVLFKDLFGEICKIKEDTQDYVEEVKRKFSEIEEKYEKLENLISENKEKSENLESREKEIEELKIRLQANISEVVLEKEKFEEELEAFQREKLEFYEDVSFERQKIQEYYDRIEEKVAVLDLRRAEIENARRQLNDEQDESSKNMGMEERFLFR